MRRVVGDLLSAGGYGNVCVINDEAHHCYDPDAMSDGPVGAEDEQAAVWFNTLRTLRDVGALGKVGEYGQESAVFDFSATPLWINMAARAEPAQFQWVASEFGLMEAIEAGLVKIPRVPIDDDSSRDETVWRRPRRTRTNPHRSTDQLPHTRRQRTRTATNHRIGTLAGRKACYPRSTLPKPPDAT